MGFDNESVLYPETIPKEFYCPACRQLVYPAEAQQTPCGHLFCRQCVAYILGTMRCCPYDNQPVNEANLKGLLESNILLYESLCRIPVRCIYHKSGCGWQSHLADIMAHSSNCTYGSSPVFCNKCGMQIMHRDIPEHVVSCTGAIPQTQHQVVERGRLGTSVSHMNASGQVQENIGSQQQSQPVHLEPLLAQQTSGQPVAQCAKGLEQPHVPSLMGHGKSQLQQHYQQHEQYQQYQQYQQDGQPQPSQSLQHHQQQLLVQPGQPFSSAPRSNIMHKTSEKNEQQLLLPYMHPQQYALQSCQSLLVGEQAQVQQQQQMQPHHFPSLQSLKNVATSWEQPKQEQTGRFHVTSSQIGHVAQLVQPHAISTSNLPGLSYSMKKPSTVAYSNILPFQGNTLVTVSGACDPQELQPIPTSQACTDIQAPHGADLEKASYEHQINLDNQQAEQFGLDRTDVFTYGQNNGNQTVVKPQPDSNDRRASFKVKGWQKVGDGHYSQRQGNEASSGVFLSSRVGENGNQISIESNRVNPHFKLHDGHQFQAVRCPLGHGIFANKGIYSWSSVEMPPDGVTRHMDFAAGSRQLNLEKSAEEAINLRPVEQKYPDSYMLKSDDNGEMSNVKDIPWLYKSNVSDTVEIVSHSSLSKVEQSYSKSRIQGMNPEGIYPDISSYPPSGNVCQDSNGIYSQNQSSMTGMLSSDFTTQQNRPSELQWSGNSTGTNAASRLLTEPRLHAKPYAGIQPLEFGARPGADAGRRFFSRFSNLEHHPGSAFDSESQSCYPLEMQQCKSPGNVRVSLLDVDAERHLTGLNVHSRLHLERSSNIKGQSRFHDTKPGNFSPLVSDVFGCLSSSKSPGKDYGSHPFRRESSLLSGRPRPLHNLGMKTNHDIIQTTDKVEAAIIGRKEHMGSSGWCRICLIDCFTVDGLKRHCGSETHQKKSLEIVKNIKCKSTKKQKSVSSLPKHSETEQHHSQMKEHQKKSLDFVESAIYEIAKKQRLAEEKLSESEEHQMKPLDFVESMRLESAKKQDHSEQISSSTPENHTTCDNKTN